MVFTAQMFTCNGPFDHLFTKGLFVNVFLPNSRELFGDHFCNKVPLYLC